MTYLTNGEIREEISYAVGGDPTRYSRDAYGRGLTKDEVYRAAVQLQPEDDDHDLPAMTLENLYRVVCRWAGGEYSANSGNAWGINRENLKLIHDAVGGRSPQEVVTDGGVDQSTDGEDEKSVPGQIRDAIQESDWPELSIREIMDATNLSKNQILGAASRGHGLEIDEATGAVRCIEDDGGEFVDDFEREVQTDGGVDTSVDGTDRDDTSMKKAPMSEKARDRQLFWHVLIPRRAFTGHHCANTLTESSAIAYTVRRSRSLMDRSLTCFRLEERTNTHTRKTPKTARAIRSTPHTFFSIEPIRPERQKHFSGGEYA